MHWLILLIAIAIALTIAAICVICEAKLLSRIRSATARRWIVIAIALFVAGHVIALLYLVAMEPKDVAEAPRPLIKAYERLPTITTLWVLTSLVAILSLIGLTIVGFLPEKGVPYRPWAASWRLGRTLKRLGLLVGLLMVAILLQDFELRWRLSHLESHADALAESMKPAVVADENNAAKQYQQVVDLSDEFHAWTDTDEYRTAVAGIAGCKSIDDATRKAFQPLEPVFELLRKAAQCEECRFDDNYATLDILTNKTNSRISSAMWVLTRYAEFEACQQHPDRAIDCIRIRRRWEEHLIADGRNAESVHFNWTESSIRGLIEHMATYCEKLPADQLTTLIAPPLPIDTIHELGVKWQAAVVGKQLAVTYDGRIFQHPKFPDREIFAQQTPQAVAAIELTCATLRFLYARDDLTSFANRFDCVNSKYDPATWNDRDRLDSTPEGNFTDRYVMMGNERHLLIQAEQHRRLANIGIAAALYHQEHASWPATLADLAPKYLQTVPLDLKNNQPFVVKHIDDGLMVYPPSEAEWLEKQEAEGTLMQEASQRIVPMLFLGDALRRVDAVGK